MATHPLAESLAKIIRAKGYIGHLSTEAALWIQEMEAADRGPKLEFTLSASTRLLEGRVANVPEAPPYRFGLIIGEVVHHLRGALDHLAWELSNLATPGRADHVTQFPICQSKAEFDKKGHRLTAHMDGRHRSLIEAEQPFVTDTALPQNAALSKLAELSNQDKHQGIRPVSVSHASYYRYPDILTATAGWNTHGFQVEPGALVMSAQLPVGTVALGIRANDTGRRSTIAIVHGYKHFEEADEALTAIANRVEAIVEKFAPLFPGTRGTEIAVKNVP